MMTKASFTNEQWKHLCSFAHIGPVDKKLYKLGRAGGLTQQELDEMAVTEKTVRNPAKEKVHRARVCCLQNKKSAPGCKGVLPITSREEEHSNDIQLVDDMTQGDIFDQLSISLKHPLQAVSCPPDVEKEPMLKAEAHSVSYDPQGQSSSKTVIAGQRTMPTRKIVHDAPLPSGVSRTPAGRFCTISIEARGAAEPQPTEGGSALRS